MSYLDILGKTTFALISVVLGFTWFGLTVVLFVVSVDKRRPSGKAFIAGCVSMILFITTLVWIRDKFGVEIL